MHLLDFHLCIVAGSVLSENPICELLGYGTTEQQLWVLVDTFGDFWGAGTAEQNLLGWSTKRLQWRNRLAHGTYRQYNE